MLATGAVANWLAGVVAQRRQSRKLAVWQLPLTSDSFLDGRVDVGLCRDHRGIGLCYRFLFSTPTNMIQESND